MSFGEKLKTLRQERNLTTRELAVIFKLGKSTISNYENNTREPDYDTLIKFSNYYDVSIDWLLEREKYVQVQNDNINKLSQYINDLNDEQIELIINLIKQFK